MELVIDDRYRITADDRNFIVERRKVIKSGEKAGESTWGNATYHGNLTQACQKVLREHISTSAACELGQVIEAVERAERAVTQAVRVVDNERQVKD